MAIVRAQVVDQSINGVQLGFMGIWLHNESKIAQRWALRTEIGYEALLNPNHYNTIIYHHDKNTQEILPNINRFPIFLPVISLETRWYYNSPKRQGNSKNTFHNSSNFAALAIRYYPEILAFSPHEINELDGGVFLVPSWGIRRNLSYRINYELGAGLGLDVYELLTEPYATTDPLFNIHIRIGYKFGKRAFQEN
ncbi:MAG: hypothetical protein AB8B59_06165 [Maribacter sp.]